MAGESLGLRTGLHPMKPSSTNLRSAALCKTSTSASKEIL